MSESQILIRPEVAIYAAFARLNYKPWYALAEFVDNAVQSALTNSAALQAASKETYRLRIDITIGEDSIEIRDNAAGIGAKDYSRAFLPASPPPDTSGLSEFGLGMKAAASWFSQVWSVRTTALGEPVERMILFDIPKIVGTKCNYLKPTERAAKSGEHYTTLTLSQLRVHPKGRTVGKIRDHLCSIYRSFIRDGFLELCFNGDALVYEPPGFLVAPYHRTPNKKAITWRKEIVLDMEDGQHRVKGWAGILGRASVANAGFAIFRRRRLIQGSYGEAYRPEVIFGASNKFIYQRLVGELEVEGFSVSHTKDGIQWDEWEEDILEWLKRELDADPIPLLDQAANFRARSAVTRDMIRIATLDTSTAIAQHLPPIIDEQVAQVPSDEPLPDTLEDSEEDQSEEVEINLEHANKRWSVRVELVNSSSRDGWYEIAKTTQEEDSTRVEIRVNLAHPFMVRFISADGDEIVPFTRLAAGLAIAEITAREAGARYSGMLRTNLNQILRGALSGPIQRGEKDAGRSRGSD